MRSRLYRLFLMIGLIFLGTVSSVAAQEAAGLKGMPPYPIPPFSWGSHYFVSPDFNHDQVILARAYDGVDHLYRSTNGGGTWRVSLNADIWAVGFSSNYTHDQTLYAAPREQSALLRSTDGGATWRNVPAIDTGWSWSFPVIAVVDTDTLFLALNGGSPAFAHRRGLFHSTDGGITWERLVQGDVNDLALSPRYPEDHTLFIAARSYKVNYGLFKSTDDGHTWSPRSAGLYLSGGFSTGDIVFSPGYPTDPTLFCQSTGLAYRSVDGGDSWQQIYPQEPLVGPPPWGHGLWVLSPYFAHDRTAWLDGGWQLTTDAGNSWTAHESYLHDLTARESCTAAGQCGVLLLGAGGNFDYAGGVGIYKSYDLGRTWHCPQEDVTPPWAELPAEVPEPATWLLLGSGLAALAGWARRR